MHKHFVEIVVKDILPAVRAQIAIELMQKHKFNQQTAAKKLGVTQAAISQYIRQLRGYKMRYLEEDSIKQKVSQLADIVAQVGFESEQALKALSEICKLIKNKYFKPCEEIYPGLEFCEIQDQSG